MADRSILVRLRADVGDFTSKMQQASSEASRFVGKHEKSFDEVGSASMKAGALITGAFALAGGASANFEQALSNVAATGADARNNMGALRDAAIEMGAKTAFSATEAAAGIENLLKAGVSASDVLGGGLQGALDLAAAGSLQVGDAAEIASTAMTQFKLSGADVPHIADLLAAGAGKAAGEVSDMAMALKQSGLVASQTGLSIEETTGTLAAFASAGLLGSDAGTSFKSMLQRLSNPSKEAATTMADLGIAAYDTQGNFVGVAALAGQLQSALTDLTPAQRDAAMATIFGADAVRAASVLYQQGAVGIQSWIAQVNDQGFAAETAATKMDNLKGDLEALGGSFETLLIQMGSGAQGPLRGLVQGLGGVVDVFATLPAPIQQTATMLAGATGIFLLVGGAALKAAPSIREMHASFRDLVPVGGKAEGALKGLGKAAGIASAAMLALAAVQWAGQTYQAGVDATRASIAELGAAATAAAGGKMTQLDDAYRQLGGSATSAGIEIAALQRTTGTSADGFLRFANSIVGLKAPTMQVEEQTRRLDEALSNMPAQQAAEAFRNLSTEAVKYGADQGKMVDQFSAYRDSLIAQATALNVTGLSAKELFDWMGGKVPAAVQAAADAADSSDPAIQGLADGLDDAAAAAGTALDKMLSLGSAMLKLSGSQMGYEASLDDATAAIKEHGKAALDAAGGIDISTEKGRALKGALDDVASSSLSVIDGMVKAGEETGKVSAFQQRAAQDFIATATAMGMGQVEAIALAAQYGLIPKEVATAVSAPGAKLSDQQARELTAALMAVPALTSAQVLAPGARPSKSDVDAFVSSVGRVPGVTTAQINTLASLYGVDQARQALASLRDKTVYVDVVSLQRSTRMDKPVADGGLFVGAGLEQRFAAGGFMGSFQGQQSQIRPAGGTGVRWAEEGAGPWEAFISGHPAKRWRSRWLLQEVAARLGGQVAWTSYADGGIHTHDSYRPSAVASSVTTQVQAISRADLDYLSDRLAGIVLDGAQRSIQTARRSSAMAGRASA